LAKHNEKNNNWAVQTKEFRPKHPGIIPIFVFLSIGLRAKAQALSF